MRICTEIKSNERPNWQVLLTVLNLSLTEDTDRMSQNLVSLIQQEHKLAKRNEVNETGWHMQRQVSTSLRKYWENW